MTSSSSDSGKTVSTAMETSSDAAPAESDLGVRDAELAGGDGPGDADSDIQKAPQPFSGGGGSDAGPTAGPDDKQV